MSRRRRPALLEFAAGHDAIVVEDDCDSEFRLCGRPLDALQTMDRHQRVFYVGTSSKSLLPSARLGFVVAPAWAVDTLVAAKHRADWHTNLTAQEALASFIAEGRLLRRVRRRTGGSGRPPIKSGKLIALATTGSSRPWFGLTPARRADAP